MSAGESARERLRILRAAHSIAIVGFSPTTARSSYYVATYLVQDTDYRLSFVNPRAAGQTVLGHTIHASLADLPEVPDIVDVFRRAEDLPGVVDEVIALDAPTEGRTVWFQLGLVNESAAETARAAGLGVVQNRCLKIEHARFHGGLHLAGFDTGVISSRKGAR
ncbi:MAG: CoA-binding protein [Nocardioides sp.]|uniref:CoA-binding protein n=1 Tax=Nocardioides sp. TaxID=35761 RepID=UPI0039E5C717